MYYGLNFKLNSSKDLRFRSWNHKQDHVHQQSYFCRSQDEKEKYIER